jgi:hypothetical protein
MFEYKNKTKRKAGKKKYDEQKNKGERREQDFWNAIPFEQTPIRRKECSNIRTRQRERKQQIERKKLDLWIEYLVSLLQHLLKEEKRVRKMNSFRRGKRMKKLSKLRKQEIDK